MAFDPKKYLQEIGVDEPSLGVADFARPIIQGASLGFSDEAAGGLGAVRDLIQGKTGLDWEAIKQAYEANRDSERSANKETEERNPRLYKALEIGGGFAAPIGAIGNAAKGASLLAKAGKLALGGGLAGGAAGLGFSEAEDAGQLTRDALKGAAFGAAPGALLGGVAGAAKLGEHIPILGIGKAAQGLEQGLKGNLPGNIKFTEKVEELLGKLGSKKKELSQSYEAILEKAASENRRIDASDFIEFSKKLEDELRFAKSPEVVADIQNVLNDVRAYTTRGLPAGRIETPMLDPREAQHLKSSLGEKARFSVNPTLKTGEGRQMAGALKGKLAEDLGENLPGLKQTDSQYADLENVLRQLGIKPEKLYTKNALTGELEINPKTLNVVQTLLKRSVNEKASGDVAKKSVDLLGQGMEKLGLDSELPTLLDKAKSSNVFDRPLSKASAYLGYGTEKTLGAEPTARTLMMAPETIGLYDKKPHNSYELSKNTKTASKDEMLQLADTAIQIPGLSNTGEKLKESIESGNIRVTNQLMFDLLQRPKFRNSVEGMISDKEEMDE